MKLLDDSHAMAQHATLCLYTAEKLLWLLPSRRLLCMFSIECLLSVYAFNGRDAERMSHTFNRTCYSVCTRVSARMVRELMWTYKLP
jgi:hypothetical protein